MPLPQNRCPFLRGVRWRTGRAASFLSLEGEDAGPARMRAGVSTFSPREKEVGACLHPQTRPTLSPDMRWTDGNNRRANYIRSLSVNRIQ